MAHELFGQRFYGYREPAWHGLGKIFTHEPTAIEAFREAGLMYEIRKVPVFAYIDGTNHLVQDQWALVREPTEDDPEYKVFGLVGEQYCVVNNADIAPIVDILAQEWPIETVGALKDGRTIFVTLRAGLDEIEGDEIAKFFLLTDTKDGSGALKLAFTPVRVVCQNTLTSALHGTRDQFSLIHNDFVRMDLKAAIDIIAASKRQEANVLEVFRRMAAVQRDIEELDRIISDPGTVFPGHAEYILEHLEEPLQDLYPRKAFLRLAALYHDAGKALTMTRDDAGRIHFYSHQRFSRDAAAELVRRLRLSRRAGDYVVGVVGGHMDIGLTMVDRPTRRQLRRLLARLGDELVDVVRDRKSVV